MTIRNIQPVKRSNPPKLSTEAARQAYEAIQILTAQLPVKK